MRRLNVVFAAVVVSASCIGEADAADIAIIGPDGTTCYPSIKAALEDHNHVVDVYEDITQLGSIDLCVYDIVWLASGISPANPGCPGETVPDAAGEANLLEFLTAGGSVFFMGEDGTPRQLQFLEWRDAFINSIGGGGFDGTCLCSVGSTIYLDPGFEISTTPNLVDAVTATSTFTGGIESFGNSTPFAWANTKFTGTPVGAFFDYGDITGTPNSRMIVFNNTNNTAESFQIWVPNAARYLEGTGNGICPADIVPNCVVDTEDLLALLAQWGSCADCAADFDGSGVVDVGDLLQLLAAWGDCVA